MLSDLFLPLFMPLVVSPLLPLSLSLFLFKEDPSENEEVFPKEITKWSSNDLMDKIETHEPGEVPGNLFAERGPLRRRLYGLGS